MAMLSKCPVTIATLLHAVFLRSEPRFRRTDASASATKEKARAKFVGVPMKSNAAGFAASTRRTP